jgi:competence protein ComEC
MAAVLFAGGGIALAIAGPPEGDPPSPEPGLEVSVLDVGQGDAILLEPAGAEPVLVDAGPPGEGIAEELTDEGVERLGLLAITHDQLDHSGGVPELVAAVPVESFGYAGASPSLLAAAQRAGARPVRLAGGETIRSGSLRLEVLWPARELLEADGGAPGDSAEPSPSSTDEANRLSLVLLARWHRFSMLLTGDAEAEAAPIDPGPVDVLKVAHHGSDDAGLAELLDRALPRLAVISVGEENPYGHPAATTLTELADHDVPIMRTDSHGEIEIDVTSEGWTGHSG